MRTDRTITFECFETTELGENTYTNIAIHLRRVVTVLDTLDGCEGNAAGYGSNAAAKRVQTEMRTLRARGHKEWFDFAIDADSVTVVIKWRCFNRNSETGESEYARPKFILGQEGWSNLQNTQAFLLKVARAHAKVADYGRGNIGDWTWRQPSEILTALTAMRSPIQVDRVTVPETKGVYFVRSDVEAARKAA